MASRKANPAKKGSKGQQPIYKVLFTGDGGKDYSALDKSQRTKVDRWCATVAPKAPVSGKPMNGWKPPTWSKRLGAIRIIYHVDKTKLEVRIFCVDWRGNVYAEVPRRLKAGKY
jgi:mRNA-degrading endonuclease RelE of RelBE toxin-antitoxin system